MQPCRRQTLNEQLMDMIVSAIQNQELPAGSKLPPELEMASGFAVSRNTLRETLKILEAFGIIESLHGQGTFVSQQAMQRIPNIQIIRVLSQNQSVQSLMDARLIVEPGLAELAALRRSDAQLVQLEESIGVLFQTGVVDVKRLFHMQVAGAAHCEIMSSFLEMLFLQLLHSPYPMLQDNVAEDYTATELREHRQILQAIADRDPRAARERMEQHLQARFEMLYAREK